MTKRLASGWSHSTYVVWKWNGFFCWIIPHNVKDQVQLTNIVIDKTCEKKKKNFLTLVFCDLQWAVVEHCSFDHTRNISQLSIDSNIWHLHWICRVSTRELRFSFAHFYGWLCPIYFDSPCTYMRTSTLLNLHF